MDDAAFQGFVEGIHDEVTALGPEIIARSTTFYASGDATLVSEDRSSTIIPIVMAGDLDTADDNIESVIHLVEEANSGGQFQVFVSGFASVSRDFSETSERDLQQGESRAIPVALIILVLVFGALVAAIAPMILAFFAIIFAIALVAIVGQLFDFSFFVVNIITMMGLAVGIDYSLFIVSRFREERGRGRSVPDAIDVAGGTAGRAVLFSGLTVVIALSGLLIIQHSIFQSLALGAIFVVLGAVAASLTLLPAILSLLGDKVNRLKVPLVGATPENFEQAAGGFWDRVARTVMRRPLVSLVLAGGLLIAATIPFFSIDLGSSGVTSFPDSFQTKQGFLLLESDFDGGQVNPAEVVIDGDVNAAPVQGALDELKVLVAQDASFGPARPLEVNESGDLGLLAFQLPADPASDEAVDAIDRLRSQYVPQAFAGVDAEVVVTGLAATNLDSYELTASMTPIAFVFVLGLSFLLLMLVFRSIVVPAKAIVLNLLSVGAAYGLIVLVFQKGVGNEIFGFQQVENIEFWLPLFLFAILFGLSMDYHVFLLSRIRERYDQTGDNTEAVAFGVRSTGRLITGAALIMVAVFGGFAMGELVMLQQMGFGLAVAVFMDATIIRSVLVPASMRLRGSRNWYLPPVLSWLPRLGMEEREPSYVPKSQRVS